jgi:ribonuclease BN (tRNA processing enzyme)
MTAYITDLDEAFDLNEIRAGEVLDAFDAKLSFVEMAHPPETVGVRIEHGGAVFAYSADTGPEADFHALASSADLFVCEATLQDSDERWEGHLRAAQTALIARDLGSSRLVLTHLPPGRDHALSLQEARAASPDSDIELANDGDRLEVGS